MTQRVCVAAGREHGNRELCWHHIECQGGQVLAHHDPRSAPLLDREAGGAARDFRATHKHGLGGAEDPSPIRGTEATLEVRRVKEVDSMHPYGGAAPHRTPARGHLGDSHLLPAGMEQKWDFTVGELLAV